MKNIQVDKKELIGILKKNLNTHVSEHIEALDGYHKEVVKQLTTALDKAVEGSEYITHIQLAKPQSSEISYTTIIGMMELDTVDTVELTEHEYKQYVLDDWSWSHSSKMLNATYLGN